MANDIRTSLPRGSVYRLAFVAYHDMGDSPRFELGPFNTDVEAILSQMRSVYARGGADEPEVREIAMLRKERARYTHFRALACRPQDVAGGLAEVLKFGWDAATKIVIHIADAPPHGHDYNDCGSGDSYPSGTTECPQPRELMRDLASRGIDYTFFKINHSTDKMLRVFSEAWNEGAADPERQSFTVMDMQHGTQGAESYPMVEEAESSFGATVGMAMPCFDESIPMAVPTSSAYAAEADDCVPSLRSESEGERSAPIPRSMPSAMAYSSMAMPSMAMPSMAPMAPMAASAGMPSMARSAAAGPSFGEALTKSVMASVAKRRV